MSKEIESGMLTVIYGGMFSGKTTTLNGMYGDGVGIAVYKSEIDDRFEEDKIGEKGKLVDGFLFTHGQVKIPAKVYPESNPSLTLRDLSLRSDIVRVLIDEVNFAPHALIEVIDKILSGGIDVVIAGIDKTHDLKPFGIMPELINKARELKSVGRGEAVQLTAVCDGCGEDTATLSYAKFDKQSDIAVGGAELYGPACNLHHSELGEEPKKMREKGVVSVLGRPKALELPGVHRIEIGGDGMRVGKTTSFLLLSERLEEEGYEVIRYFEEWENNEHLADSYGDIDAFVRSQDWFADDRFRQISEQFYGAVEFAKNWKPGDKQRIYIQEVNPEMNLAYMTTKYMMDLIPEDVYRLHVEKQLGRDWNLAPFPNLLVHHRMPRSDILVKRGNENRREFEEYEPDYLLTMRRMNQYTLNQEIERYPGSVLPVDDLGDFDFAHDPEAQEELVRRVVRGLGLVALKE